MTRGAHNDRRTVEVFLPSTLTADQVRHRAYSAIRVIANDAGDFVEEIRIRPGISQADGWCKWIAQYLPAPRGGFRDHVVE
jgi:hypothetical protein